MCKNNENEKTVEISVGEMVRDILTDMAYTMFSMCQDIGITRIKLSAGQDPDTGTCIFKAKVDGQEVLSIKADDLVPYFAD